MNLLVLALTAFAADSPRYQVERGFLVTAAQPDLPAARAALDRLKPVALTTGQRAVEILATISHTPPVAPAFPVGVSSPPPTAAEPIPAAVGVLSTETPAAPKHEDETRAALSSGPADVVPAPSDRAFPQTSDPSSKPADAAKATGGAVATASPTVLGHDIDDGPGYCPGPVPHGACRCMESGKECGLHKCTCLDGPVVVGATNGKGEPVKIAQASEYPTGLVIPPKAPEPLHRLADSSGQVWTSPERQWLSTWVAQVNAKLAAKKRAVAAPVYASPVYAAPTCATGNCPSAATYRSHMGFFGGGFR